MPHARTTDPATSLAAAMMTDARRRQRDRLLAAFYYARTRYDLEFLTAEEAAEQADMLNLHTCWWRRVTDLAQDGLIAPVLTAEGDIITVRGAAGRQVTVYAITALGMSEARAMLLRAAVPA